MKNKTINLIITISLMIVLLAGISYSQNKNNMKVPDSCKMMMDKKIMPDSCKMDMDSCKMMMKNMKHKMNMKNKTKMNKKTSIIRKGVIDLVSIDKNKDGKVFQDQMDWNVISDKAGTCPLCGMKLKEVTLKKAKENLMMKGFKVK